MASKLLLGLLVLVAAVATFVLYALKLDARPQDTTAARVYTEDPHPIDYCSLPELDGSALRADDIPKAYTPDCEVEQWPALVLAGCTEPLPPEAADLRGLWQVVEGGLVGHVERIEQCGNRVVVSNDRFIHDFRTSGTLGEGANDINPVACFRIRAAVRWNDEGTLEFRPWNLATVVTRRLQDENTMLWKYPGQPLSRLERICRLAVSGRQGAAAGRRAPTSESSRHISFLADAADPSRPARACGEGSGTVPAAMRRRGGADVDRPLLLQLPQPVRLDRLSRPSRGPAGSAGGGAAHPGVSAAVLSQ